ncbi:hypothetical protein VNO77_19014 [Canavalia gladiata]|uniref:Uncharacterized protein n=1 Tax=Canavalia gladiata TaxID=3824 RepID=A0AAN9LQS4_CANGL
MHGYVRHKSFSPSSVSLLKGRFRTIQESLDIPTYLNGMSCHRPTIVCFLIFRSLDEQWTRQAQTHSRIPMPRFTKAQVERNVQPRCESVHALFSNNMKALATNINARKRDLDEDAV